MASLDSAPAATTRRTDNQVGAAPLPFSSPLRLKFVLWNILELSVLPCNGLGAEASARHLSLCDGSYLSKHRIETCTTHYMVNRI